MAFFVGQACPEQGRRIANLPSLSVMKTVIAANGILEPNIRLTKLWRAADLRIAADGGARIARAHLQLAPHIVIGDFDSVHADTLQWLKDAGAEVEIK